MFDSEFRDMRILHNTSLGELQYLTKCLKSLRDPSYKTESEIEKLHSEIQSGIRKVEHCIQKYERIPDLVLQELRRWVKFRDDRQAIDVVSILGELRRGLGDAKRRYSLPNALMNLVQDSEEIRRRIDDVRAGFEDAVETGGRATLGIYDAETLLRDLDRITRDYKAFEFFESKGRGARRWGLSEEDQGVLEGNGEALAVLAFVASDIMALRTRIRNAVADEDEGYWSSDTLVHGD